MTKLIEIGISPYTDNGNEVNFITLNDKLFIW